MYAYNVIENIFIKEPAEVYTITTSKYATFKSLRPSPDTYFVYLLSKEFN